MDISTARKVLQKICIHHSNQRNISTIEVKQNTLIIEGGVKGGEEARVIKTNGEKLESEKIENSYCQAKHLFFCYAATEYRFFIFCVKNSTKIKTKNIFVKKMKEVFYYVNCITHFQTKKVLLQRKGIKKDFFISSSTRSTIVVYKKKE